MAPTFLNDLGLPVVGNQLVASPATRKSRGTTNQVNHAEDIIAGRFGKIMNFAFIQLFYKNK